MEGALQASVESEVADDAAPLVRRQESEAERVEMASHVLAYLARMHKKYRELLIFGRLLREQHEDEEARTRDVERTLDYIGWETDRLRRNAALTYREALALELPLKLRTQTTG